MIIILPPSFQRYGNVTVQLIGDDNADTLFGIDTENYVVVRNSLDFSSTARYQVIHCHLNVM